MACPSFFQLPTSPFPSGGSGSFGITTADFNGDGKPDLAITNSFSHTVSVFLGNGAGGFTPVPGSPFPSGGFVPIGIMTADFNGDGKPDLAVANFSSHTVSVFLGNGAGGFAPAPGSPFPSGGMFPRGITVADFNSDGKPDLAVTNDGSNTVSVFLGNGLGGFALSSTFSSGGAGPIGITTADFNSDGKPDLAVANFGSDTVSVFLGNGLGGFALSSTFSSGGSDPVGITTADFNGDGKPDLAVTNENSHTVSVFLSNGAGGFAPAPGSPFFGGFVPSGIVAANLNCDGIADLAVINRSSNRVSILIGNGNGSFQPPIPFPVGNGPFYLTTADFNGDGRSDLAIVNTSSNNVSVLINNCVPVPTCPDITVSNDLGQCGAKVNYSTPVSGCPGVTVTCSPASGSFFPVGTTMVTCTAFDGTGNTESCSFTVTVLDTEPPEITCPADITVENDPGQCGAIVTYEEPKVTDNCPGPIEVICSPASGSFFPVGTTTVTCTATDAAGNTAECTFTVTVNDTEPPEITCPADIMVAGDPGQNGAVVNYPDPIVSDNCPGVTFTCNPPSGSFFPVGTTPVTCIATDASGNTAQCSFLVTVTPPAQPETVQTEVIRVTRVIDWVVIPSSVRIRLDLFGEERED